MARIKIDATTWKESKTVDGFDYEYEVGDAKQPEFHEQTKIVGFGNESNVSFRLVSPFPANGGKTLVEDPDKIRQVSSNYETRFYAKPGAFEFDLILRNKPVSNVLVFTTQSKNVLAHHQPALTQAEIDFGDYRPDNVVGSYAFYHSSRNGHARGQRNYGTGKFLHLYRPLITDDLGAESWGEWDVNLDAGLTTLTIDPRWLARASLPIHVDPTFGSTVAGASNGTCVNHYGLFAFGTPTGGNGNVDNIQAYLQASAAPTDPEDVKGVLWDDLAGSNYVQKERTGGISIGGLTKSWRTLTMAGTTSVVSGTQYLVGLVGQGGTETAYDVASNTGGFDFRVGIYAGSVTTLTDPLGVTDRTYSIYANYTVSAAALAASVTSSVSVSGALTVPKPLAASVTSAVTVVGALTVPKPLAASVTSAVTVSGALDVPKPLAATVSVPIAVTADLTAPGSGADLASSVSSSVTVTGALDVPKPLTASVSAAVTVTGALDVPKPLASSVSVPISVTADLTAPGAGADLASSVSSSVTVTGALDVPKPLAASVSVPLSVTADLTIGGAAAELAASVSVPITVSAALTVAHDLAASVSVPITATADLTAGIALAASVSVPITVSADLVVPKPLAASVSSAITVSADLTAPGASAALASTVSLPITVVGALDVPKPLAATVSLPVTASANLTAPDAGADLSATVSVTLSTEGLLFLPSTLVVEDRDLLWLSTARQAKSISTNRDISQI